MIKKTENKLLFNISQYTDQYYLKFIIKFLSFILVFIKNISCYQTFYYRPIFKYFQQKTHEYLQSSINKYLFINLQFQSKLWQNKGRRSKVRYRKRKKIQIYQNKNFQKINQITDTDIYLFKATFTKQIQNHLTKRIQAHHNKNYQLAQFQQKMFASVILLFKQYYQKY
ncbi:transmembrane protein, putative (macronuclear) [Tetrahymena thermophila SB210]|uniref:Transmembrane protein, putative n=1 Tax=Tetrahymena thermophila (strain SB210) TaxID=312017 RepID=W7X0J0_TETTS|nr:transmembrane protein, putative [Tetrahymena thermophila SB210]EWS72645.1 transmembrane protein, putative [Tetrahymena thermophila SB210]|eukprot:XP_012654813.1 transmembrane protein, putative [Tetrahymena thermophila SB210]